MKNREGVNLVEDIGKRGEKLLQSNLSQGEEAVVKLKGIHGEALVITNKRLYVLKWGFMAGTTFGGRCITFDFKSITGIELKKGLLTGAYEILTPATQNTRKSYWGGRGNDTTSSDNIISFNRDKYQHFEEAARTGRELLHKHSSQITSDNQNDDLAKLEKLAELKEKGILTEKEFQAKKKQLLGL